MFTERGYKRGKLLSVEQYDANNTLLKKIKYGYVQGNVETDYVLSSNLLYVNNGASAVFSYFTGGIYKLLFPRYDVVADSTITYYANGNVEDINAYDKKNSTLSIDYGYPHKTFVRTLSSETRKRKGKTVRKEYTYPFFTGNAAADSVGSSLFTLEPISEKTYINGRLANGYMKNHRFDSAKKPVEDSRMRINTDGNKDTIVWYHTYDKQYRPETYTDLGRPKTKLVWYGTYIGEYNIGVDASPANDMKSFLLTQYVAPSGNIEEIVFPNGQVFNWYYDADGRVTGFYENYYDIPIKTFYYNYKNK